MELEHVHALIDTKPRVDILHERAARGRDEADHNRNPRLHVPSRRRDTDKPGDGALAGPDDAEPLLVLDVIHQHPADDAGRRRRVGVEEHQPRAHRHAEGRAAVEAEPADVDEHGAEEDEGDVVRLLLGLALVLALAEDEGVGERAAARSDVDGAAAGEVERGELGGRRSSVGNLPERSIRLYNVR